MVHVELIFSGTGNARSESDLFHISQHNPATTAIMSHDDVNSGILLQELALVALEFNYQHSEYETTSERGVFIMCGDHTELIKDLHF